MRVPIFVSAKTVDFSSRKQLLKGPVLTLLCSKRRAAACTAFKVTAALSPNADRSGR
jgi:hypothetical protein